jgi:hypothetical protein
VKWDKEDELMEEEEAKGGKKKGGKGKKKQTGKKGKKGGDEEDVEEVRKPFVLCVSTCPSPALHTHQHTTHVSDLEKYACCCIIASPLPLLLFCFCVPGSPEPTMRIAFVLRVICLSAIRTHV